MSELIQLIQQEREAVSNGALVSVLAIDRRIERCFAEKDRAFSDLQQHIREHGC